MRTPFKSFLFLMLLLLTSAFAANTDEVAVKDAYEKWCASIGTAKGNPAVVTQFYAHDAILLPTLSQKILINTEGGLDEYFSHLTSYKNIRCVPEKLTTHMKGDVAINTGLYEFTYTDSANHKKVIPARFTFIYKKEDGKWLIINHHSSKLP